MKDRQHLQRRVESPRLHDLLHHAVFRDGGAPEIDGGGVVTEYQLELLLFHQLVAPNKNKRPGIVVQQGIPKLRVETEPSFIPTDVKPSLDGRVAKRKGRHQRKTIAVGIYGAAKVVCLQGAIGALTESRIAKMNQTQYQAYCGKNTVHTFEIIKNSGNKGIYLLRNLLTINKLSIKKIKQSKLMNSKPAVLETRYVLAVQNLAASVDYYSEKLGFTTDWAYDGWQQMRRGPIVVMLGECAEDRSAFETRNHSYFAYIQVEGVDALHEELSEKGVQIHYPLGSKPWGMREFGIITLDGHRIMFGEELK